MRDSRRVKGGALATVSEGLPALARDDRNFFTRAAADGDVYGELVRTDKSGVRWRRWDPHRSKLAAALHAGALADGLEVVFHSKSVLYLGAANGTTVSHLADIFAPRPVFAVEFASRPFQDLLEKLKPWGNVLPVLADARRPQEYRGLVGESGAIVQDVAQPEQVAILAKNARAFLQEGAMVTLFLKARSEESTADPAEVFARAREALAEDFSWIKERGLDPFDHDHRVFIARFDG